MSLWKDEQNRTILISSIFLLLFTAAIVFFAVFPFEDQNVTGLNWAFLPAPLIIIVSLLFWGFYFNLLLVVGTIREKMDTLPGWTEIIACAIITLLASIFLGNLDNFAVKWVVFGGTALGVVLTTLWFLMSSTRREVTVPS
ncbi:MAG: hypothetical protein GF308_17565 [Candidatus Heimdallarchaeota archaeon]|nr:hypothetical protein [Candidatus Heimdallarchaeota archaeon]